MDKKITTDPIFKILSNKRFILVKFFLEFDKFQ